MTGDNDGIEYTQFALALLVSLIREYSQASTNGGWTYEYVTKRTPQRITCDEILERFVDSPAAEIIDLALDLPPEVICERLQADDVLVQLMEAQKRWRRLPKNNG